MSKRLGIEAMITSSERDGTWDDYDEVLFEKIAHAVNVPVIACGGEGNTDDLESSSYWCFCCCSRKYVRVSEKRNWCVDQFSKSGI